MAASSKSRQRVSALLPIAEHRQAKVCDSSFLDEASFSAAASSAQSKTSSRHGNKVVRPLVNLKKAFVKMLASEQRSPTGSETNAAWSSSDNSRDNNDYWPAFSVGMGMVPVTTYM